MNGRRKYALSIAFVTAFFAVGIPYWMVPYGSVNLPDALYGPGLYVVGIAAFLLRVFGVATFARTVVAIGAAVPAAAFARVAIEGIIDSTSHNLWPLEIIIALIAGLICSVAGAAAGSVVARLLPTDREAESSLVTLKRR
jgi:hypothetical protein